MVGILITGHGESAPGLKSAADMVAGCRSHIVAIPLTDANAADFDRSLRRKAEVILAECGSVLVLADIMGGTPFSQAMLCAHELGGIEVVCGANLPMLIEVLAARDQGADLARLVAVAVEAGRLGVDHLPPALLDGASGVGG